MKYTWLVERNAPSIRCPTMAWFLRARTQAGILAAFALPLIACPPASPGGDDDSTNQTPTPIATSAPGQSPSPYSTTTPAPSSPSPKPPEATATPRQEEPTPTPTAVPVPTPGPLPPPAPIYVTIAGHIEDTTSYTVCDLYPSYRTKLLEFADYLDLYQVPFNLQVEYEFLVGVRDCEDEDLKKSTDGLNVLDYLATVRGYEIDPHEEGGWEEGADDYADVRYLAGELVPSVTDTVGGFKWDDQDQYDALDEGESGWISPDFTWYPDILTLAVSTLHHEGNFDYDDLTSGVWRPAGANELFHIDAPSARMIYVGPGLQHQNWGGGDCAFEDIADYVGVLIAYMDEGRIDPRQLYTSTLAIPQGVIFDKTQYDLVGEKLDRLQPYVDAGRVVFASYQTVVRDWIQKFGGRPNQFLFDDIDPADFTCP